MKRKCKSLICHSQSANLPLAGQRNCNGMKFRTFLRFDEKWNSCAISFLSGSEFSDDELFSRNQIPSIEFSVLRARDGGKMISVRFPPMALSSKNLLLFAAALYHFMRLISNVTNGNSKLEVEFIARSFIY